MSQTFVHRAAVAQVPSLCAVRKGIPRKKKIHAAVFALLLWPKLGFFLKNFFMQQIILWSQCRLEE